MRWFYGIKGLWPFSKLIIGKKSSFFQHARTCICTVIRKYVTGGHNVPPWLMFSIFSCSLRSPYSPCSLNFLHALPFCGALLWPLSLLQLHYAEKRFKLTLRPGSKAFSLGPHFLSQPSISCLHDKELKKMSEIKKSYILMFCSTMPELDSDL